MKNLIILTLILILNSCKCPKDTLASSLNDSTQVLKTQKMVSNNCPENGTCTIEIFRNQSLDVKTDEFGGIYYDKIDNPETSVVLYKYDKNVPKGLHDGNYSEQIVFEINNSDKNLTLTNLDLQKTKMLFGRFCFCRGQTGNYKVDNGTLKLNQTKNELQFNLDFKITKVPQIITRISETIK
jgi:hypothetical protein